MNNAPCPRGIIDTVLGVVLRILLAALFTLAGAWAAAVVIPGGGSVFIGAAAGFALISLCLLKEKSVLGFCRAHGAALSLAGVLAYAALLGLATYSELFDLGWFDWLTL